MEAATIVEPYSLPARDRKKDRPEVTTDLINAANQLRHVERAAFAGQPWATEVLLQKARKELDSMLVAAQQSIVNGDLTHDARTEVGHAPTAETAVGKA
jgi:hypothetical protein